MKLLTLLLPLLTAVVLVPTAVSRPLITDPTTGPALVGKPRSIGQASHYSPKPFQLDTNAKRFAKGLPPLAPSKSRRYKASPVRRTGASALPGLTCTGCRGVIQLYNSDNGTPIGYISSIGTSSVLYRAQDALDSNTLRVQFTLPAGATGTVTDINIVAENSKLNNAANAPYVGLASPNTGGTLGIGMGPARMVGTTQISAGSPPAVGANTWGASYKIESAVWTVDVSTGFMTLKWINPNGSPAPVFPFLSGAGSVFFGDRNAWNPSGANLAFKFVPS